MNLDTMARLDTMWARAYYEWFSAKEFGHREISKANKAVKALANGGIVQNIVSKATSMPVSARDAEVVRRAQACARSAYAPYYTTQISGGAAGTSSSAVDSLESLGDCGRAAGGGAE